MRLPWKREPSRPPAADESGLAQAAAAQRDALAGLQQARHRSPEVRAVVDRLRELRESNHFAERVQQALRDGYGPHGQ